MPKNSSSKKDTRKTIRMDKKQFAIMMFLTPAFAAIVSVLLVLTVFMPLQIPKSNESSLEVPALGGEAVEETPIPTEETPTSTEETPAETIVTTEIPAMNSVVEEKTSANGTKTTTKKTSNTSNQTKSSTTKTSSQKASTTTQKPATTTQTTTNTSTTTPKPTTPSPKEVCEARTDGPKTHIVVSLIPARDFGWIYEFFEIENPVVNYQKWTKEDGAKMIYKNNACVPSTDGFTLVEEEILEEKDLATYGVQAKNYDFWQ